MSDRKHDKNTVMFEVGKNSKDLYNKWTKKVNFFLEKQSQEGRKITTHDFRATTATNIWKRTKDIVEVQSYLGHASIDNTRIYIHEDKDELRKNISQMMKKHD